MPKQRRTLVSLAVILLGESLFLLLAAVWLALQLVSATPDSYGGAVMIVALTLTTSIGIFTLALGTIRRRSWVRGATLTCQILLASVALGMFQGSFADPALGWALLAPALLASFLLFTPSVIAATRRE